MSAASAGADVKEAEAFWETLGKRIAEDNFSPEQILSMGETSVLEMGV